MPAKSIVLVGMSIAEVDRRDELFALGSRCGASVAFLQVADPSLSAELTRLADAGATEIVLVGVSTGPLGPGQSWLRRIAAYWWRERAGSRPDVQVATALIEAVELDLVDAALAEIVPITDGVPGLTSAAWENVTAHRHQVMICRGPRCTAQGAVDNLRSVILTMLEEGLGDDDVLLVHTGCQFPCNQSPVISVQPDDVWYGGVDPAGAARIVREHLVEGTPVASLRLPR